jgi:adenine-specific DNA-methyltransferase
VAFGTDRSKSGRDRNTPKPCTEPPYGIKFGSNWQVSARKRDVKDGKLEDAAREAEQINAFRDTWKLGISSYLSYLRDRLFAARDLLTDSGSCFVQIGDENVHLVRSVMDEVFGSANFISLITYSKTAGATSEFLAGTTDYIIWYSKRREATKFRQIYLDKALGGAGAAKYNQTDSSGRPYRLDNLTSQSQGRAKGEGAASWFPVTVAGREFLPTMQSRWKTHEAGMQRLQLAGRVAQTRNTLAYVRYLDDFPAFAVSNSWVDIGGIQSRADPKPESVDGPVI